MRHRTAFVKFITKLRQQARGLTLLEKQPTGIGDQWHRKIETAGNLARRPNE
jgi:hypothetical protein